MMFRSHTVQMVNTDLIYTDVMRLILSIVVMEGGSVFHRIINLWDSSSLWRKEEEEKKLCYGG